MFFIRSVLFLSLLSVTPSAYAYLDPGAASLLLQGFIAGAVGLVGVFSFYQKKITQIIASFFKSKKADIANPNNKEQE